MPKVAIVGAGVGGLTLATALELQGFEVAVYEQAPGLRQQGSGLSLYTNAVAALRDLDLWDVVENISEPVERMLAVSSRGRLLTEVDMERIARRFSAPNVNVHRGELLAALCGAVGEATITFGFRCIGFGRDGDKVRLRFDDGTEVLADVLVGADGAGSSLRTAIHGEGAAGGSRGTSGEGGRSWAGWQGVASPRPAGVRGDACTFVLGGRAVAGLLPLSGGRLHWFVDDHRDPRNPERVSEDAPGHSPAHEALERVIGTWPPVVGEAVARTPPESISYDTIRDRIPPRQWGEGRVTLLGDAAHPMLPTLGQGACQSIEDAAALVECLGTGGEVESSLREYERRRSSRAAAFVRASRSSSDFRSRTPPAVRDAVMRAVPRRLLSYSFGRTISPAKL